MCGAALPLTLWRSRDWSPEHRSNKASTHITYFTAAIKGNEDAPKPQARSLHLRPASASCKGCFQNRFETEADMSEALLEATASSTLCPASPLPLRLLPSQFHKQSHQIMLKCETSQSPQYPKAPLYFYSYGPYLHTCPNSPSREGGPGSGARCMLFPFSFSVSRSLNRHIC